MRQVYDVEDLARNRAEEDDVNWMIEGRRLQKAEFRGEKSSQEG
jgi:hypothetical protein